MFEFPMCASRPLTSDLRTIGSGGAKKRSICARSTVVVPLSVLFQRMQFESVGIEFDASTSIPPPPAPSVRLDANVQLVMNGFPPAIPRPPPVPVVPFLTAKLSMNTQLAMVVRSVEPQSPPPP